MLLLCLAFLLLSPGIFWSTCMADLLILNLLDFLFLLFLFLRLIPNSEFFVFLVYLLCSKCNSNLLYIVVVHLFSYFFLLMFHKILLYILCRVLHKEIYISICFDLFLYSFLLWYTYYLFLWYHKQYFSSILVLALLIIHLPLYSKSFIHLLIFLFFLSSLLGHSVSNKKIIFGFLVFIWNLSSWTIKYCSIPW